MELKDIKWPEGDIECSICGYRRKASKFGSHNHNEFYLMPIGFDIMVIGLILIKFLV